MSAENKAVVQRFVEEILNKGNFAVAGELFATNFAFYFASRPGSAGVEELIEALTPFRRAFPDIRFTIEDLVAEGDKVAARFSMCCAPYGILAVPAPEIRAGIRPSRMQTCWARDGRLSASPHP
jgi:predicted ester cyclase